MNSRKSMATDRQIRVLSATCLLVFLVFPRSLTGQTGEVRIVVSTSGSTIDADGYVVALDTLRQSVSVNGSVEFRRVIPGSHTAILLDVAEDCVIPEGNPQKVVIAQGGIAEVSFKVVCSQIVSQPTRTAPPAPAAPSVATVEIPPTVSPSKPSVLPIGYFAAGYWIGTLEPPGFSSYPVRWLFYSEQKLGEVVGEAQYESPSPCSYDLILEFVGPGELVVAQQLVSGDCANGTRVVLRREGEKLLAYWLKPDENLWFEAELSRVSPNRP